MAFIVEQAGGPAYNGGERIMEMEVTELHQRIPVFIGSTNMVLQAEKFFKEAIDLTYIYDENHGYAYVND